MHCSYRLMNSRFQVGVCTVFQLFFWQRLARILNFEGNSRGNYYTTWSKLSWCFFSLFFCYTYPTDQITAFIWSKKIAVLPVRELFLTLAWNLHLLYRRLIIYFIFYLIPVIFIFVLQATLMGHNTLFKVFKKCVHWQTWRDVKQITVCVQHAQRNSMKTMWMNNL